MRASRLTLLVAVVSFIAGGAALAQTPGPPGNLTATVNPTQTISLQWTAPTSGGVPTGYVVQIGTSTGASNVSETTITGTATSFVTPVMQVGTYFIRVRAFNGSGVSIASNEVTVNVACPDPVFADNLSWRPLATNQVQVIWTKSVAELGNQTTFTVEVGSSPGLSDVLVSPPPSPSQSHYTLTMSLAAGTYYVRVIGRRSCSTATSTSVEITVVSGQATGTSQVLINEVGIRLTGPNPSLDFVELKNVGTTTMNIGSWKVLTGDAAITLGAAIPAGTTVAPGCTYLIVRSDSGIVGDLGVNDLPRRSAGLVDATGRIRDSFAAQTGSGPPFPLVEGAPLAERSSGAYARVADTDTNDNSADFVYLTTGTPQNSNQCTSGPTVPPAPTQFAAAVTGSAVTLTWTPPTTGQPLTHYGLEVGITPGGNEFAPFTLGPGLSSATFFGAPNGTFYARLRAANAQDRKSVV